MLENPNPPPGGTASTPSIASTLPPPRSSPAHTPIQEPINRAVIVFVTVCVKDRRPVLANSEMHDWLRRAWILSDHWSVGRYVIMPDHLHLFCAPRTWPALPLRPWVEYWKSMVARASNGYGPLTLPGGTASTPSGGSRSSDGRGGTRPSRQLWQRDCWDTQLRRDESYLAKWEYVRYNPVRAGLCRTASEWLFQGELNALLWHD